MNRVLLALTFLGVQSLNNAQDQDVFARAVCDHSRFCVSQPENCDPQMIGSCQAFASWRLSTNGTELEIGLYAQSTSYVAFGFSDSPSMAGSDVYACTTNNELLRSRTIGYSNSPVSLKGVSGSSIAAEDGVIRCQFSRALTLGDGDIDPEFYDLNDSNGYHIIMSWDGGLDRGGAITQHSFQNRFLQQERTDFTRVLTVDTTTTLSQETEETSSLSTETVESMSPSQETFGTATPSVEIDETMSPSQKTAETMSPSQDTSGCGTSKGCFSRPAGCDPERDGSCEVFSSWVANADRSAISIELQASTDTYIAIGFSKSGMMDDSDVYACTSNREVRRSRNGVGRRNTAQELKGVSEQSVSLTDGVIRCTFTRTAFLDDDDVLFFDLRPGNKYTILLAWGGSLSNGGDIQVHKDRIFSEDAVDLTEISEFSDDGTGDADLILRKLHGSLMVLAWLCLVSLGITTARYFKDLPGKVCGKPLWFSIHRACMTAVLLLTIVSFVIIVVAVGGFNTITSGPENIVRSLHAICGSIVTILTIINVIMAVFRPHPGEPRRNLYNWAHWAVGTTAHLMALTTILMGTSNHPEQFVVPLLPSLRSYVFWMVVAFIIFHVVLWLIFTFYQVAQNSKDSPKSSDFPLNEQGSIDVPHITSIEEENQIPPLMMSLYWVYASITVLVCLVIFVIIFL